MALLRMWPSGEKSSVACVTSSGMGQGGIALDAQASFSRLQISVVSAAWFMQ
jgi:hypothetical protein